MFPVRCFLVMLFFTLVAPAATSSAEPVETDISGVTVELLELGQQNGLLRLLVRYNNTTGERVKGDFLHFEDIVLVDNKTKVKYFGLRDSDKQLLAGPKWGTDYGGMWSFDIEPNASATLWVLFDPVPAGTVLTVQVPHAFPFDDVPVSAVPGMLSAKDAGATTGDIHATLVSVKRADQMVRANLKITNTGSVKKGCTIDFDKVLLYDPDSHTKFPLLTDATDKYHFQATPYSSAWGEGRKFDENLAPGQTVMMSMTFTAPPDTVSNVYMVLPPAFLPFEGVALQGAGGASAAAGSAVTGRSVGLEGALKELKAEVTPQEIRINLSADVLFDFDKADLKPAAENQLNNLLTVVNGKPDARVAIEGHTDVRGEADYNQKLSERRAASVRDWLIAHGVAGSRITASGAGESRPLKLGNTEEDHQANRRVEIRIST